MKFNPVWFLDATGSIHCHVLGQKKPLLYSIVAHDTTANLIVPLAEFVTTSHNAESISTYLTHTKKTYEKYVGDKAFQLAPIVVTDFSWALINGVLEAFNNCDIGQYLEWCHKVVFCKKKDESLLRYMRVRLMLCSTHYLYSLSRKLKHAKCSIELKKFILFCFSLLQNTTSIKQILSTLHNIYNVMNRAYSDTICMKSLIELRYELSNRNLSWLDEVIQKNPGDKQKIYDDENNLFMLKSSKNLKQNSKFAKFFNRVIKKWESTNTASRVSKFKIFKQNKFYSPKFFKFIRDTLYLLPLWSPIIISKWQLLYPSYDKITSLSNNIVENWFKILKHTIIRRRKVNPSILCTDIYKYLLKNYFELYHPIRIEFYPNDKKKNNKEEESWKDKRDSRKTKKPFFTLNTSTFGNSVDSQTTYDMNRITNNDFNYLFETGR